ncbi:MAG: hypothetical protein AAGH53_07890 [Pseudomonadota bacterium]
MAYNALVIRIFLSFPSDLEAEQERCKQLVSEWNAINGYRLGRYIELLTWKDVVAPQFSDRPQNVINKSIGEDYDWYIGMMWGRFGAPTGTHDSGTAEEFDNALSKYRAGSLLNLSFLFKTTAIPINNIDTEQIEKINNFKKILSEKGGLYGEFDSMEQFEITFRKILNEIESVKLEEWALEHTSELDSPNNTSNEGCVGNNENLSDLSLDSDIGLFEIAEKLQDLLREPTEFLNEWGEVTNNTSEEIISISDSINRAVSVEPDNQKLIRSLIDKTCSVMDKASEFSENNVHRYSNNSEEIGYLTIMLSDIIGDFSGDGEDKNIIISAIQSNLNSMFDFKNSVLSLNKTIMELPRLTTRFNKSRKRQVSINDEIAREIDVYINAFKTALNGHS